MYCTLNSPYRYRRTNYIAFFYKLVHKLVVMHMIVVIHNPDDLITIRSQVHALFF